MKARVARALAGRIQNDQIIGLGSGSTVELAIEEIAKRIAKEHLHICGVPTSHRTALLAAEAGIQVLSPFTDVKLDWAFDGADEVDPQFHAIKGRGGALLMEKIIAQRAGQLVLIVGEDKLVLKLGEKFPVPIEIIPEALTLVENELHDLGAEQVELRNSSEKYGAVITEHNNLILDVRFPHITEGLGESIKLITGVVEHGLFFNLTSEVIVARQSSVVSMKRSPDGQLVEQELAGV